MPPTHPERGLGHAPQAKDLSHMTEGLGGALVPPPAQAGPRPKKRKPGQLLTIFSVPPSPFLKQAKGYREARDSLQRRICIDDDTGKRVPCARVTQAPPVGGKPFPSLTERLGDSLEEMIANGEDMPPQSLLTLGEAILKLKADNIAKLRERLGMGKGRGPKARKVEEIVAEVKRRIAEGKAEKEQETRTEAEEAQGIQDPLREMDPELADLVVDPGIDDEEGVDLTQPLRDMDPELAEDLEALGGQGGVETQDEADLDQIVFTLDAVDPAEEEAQKHRREVMKEKRKVLEVKGFVPSDRPPGDPSHPFAERMKADEDSRAVMRDLYAALAADSREGLRLGREAEAAQKECEAFVASSPSWEDVSGGKMSDLIGRWESAKDAFSAWLEGSLERTRGMVASAVGGGKQANITLGIDDFSDVGREGISSALDFWRRCAGESGLNGMWTRVGKIPGIGAGFAKKTNGILDGIDLSDDQYTGESLAHEMAHGFVAVMDQDHMFSSTEMEAEFMDYRFGNEEVKTVDVEMADNKGVRKVVTIPYRDDEFGRAVEGFNKHYIGRHYGAGTIDREAFSVGMQMLYTDPTTLLRKDPEYAQFLVMMLRNKGKSEVAG